MKGALASSFIAGNGKLNPAAPTRKGEPPMWNIYSVIAIAFLAFYMFAGLYAGRKTTTVEDHYVMSRSAPAFLITGTLVASNLSSVTFTGFTGTAASVGSLGLISQFGASVTGSLILGLWLGKYFYRMKLMTVPDFFRKRYPSRSVQIVSALIVLVSMTAYMVTVMLGTVVVANSLFGWSNQVSLLAILTLITLFTVVGGMRSVVVTDTIMFFVFFAAAIVIGPSVIANLGGIGEAIEKAKDTIPYAFRWYGSEKSLQGFMRILEMNVLSFLLVLGAPHLFSRISIAKSEREFGKAMIYLAITLPFLIIGLLYSFAFFPLLKSGVKPVESFPYVCRNLVHPVLGAIGLSGVVAAAVSTATSLFQQAAATLSSDIIKQHFKPDMTNEQLLTVSRISVVVIAAVVYFGASNPAIGTATIMYAFLFATAAFAAWLPSLYLGVLWKKATAQGAFWSMAISLPLIILISIGRQTGFFPAWLPANLVALCVSTLIMIVVSLTSQTTEEEDRVFAAIHASKPL
jgi:Na+/proline symporter